MQTVTGSCWFHGAAAKKRGIKLTSRSRPLKPTDLAGFDYVIGMDAKNQRAIQAAGDFWLNSNKGAGLVPQEYSARVSLMTDYCSKFAGAKEVPDPYYGGADGFENVLDLVTDACNGLLAKIQADTRK